ncbi:MAG: AAA family ATPase [Actinomycetales bacterium]|nr:AAA family ATPase [Actinomycetales bacterium]
MPVVLGDAARDGERLRLTLPDHVETVDTVQSLTAHLDDHRDEDLVIIGPDAPLIVATEIAEKFRLERPWLGVLLLRRRLEVQLLNDALRSGIREVVLADDAQALLDACIRSQAVSRQMRHADLRAAEAGEGKVILVFSAKGGCGKTTVATNLAATMARLDVGRVCLVDLNLEFGDVAIALQVDPVRTISDALGMQGGLDRRAIESMVIPYRDRLDLLLAPTQPADAEFISAGLVGEILTALEGMYDYVIIDAPPAINDVVLKCFDMADSYLLLTSLDMLSLKNVKLTLDTLDVLGYPRSRWEVVLNRFDAKVGLTARDVEQVIGMRITTRLPSSKDVPAALNSGVALSLESPRHPFSRAVRGLAEHVSQAVPIAVRPVDPVPSGRMPGSASSRPPRTPAPSLASSGGQA